jgi:hypothetical protein
MKLRIEWHPDYWLWRHERYDLPSRRVSYFWIGPVTVCVSRGGK